MKERETKKKPCKLQTSIIKFILDEACRIENGSVTVIFQDEVIIQINKYEKFLIAG